MASIKLGNIVVDMRGKINGNVYSKNKGGAYSRVRVKPSNPRSSFQSAVRASFTTNSQAWRALTDAQRQSWIQGVTNFVRKNRVGDAHNLSGNSLYQSLNKNLSDVGIAPISTCPAPADVTPVAVSTAVAANGAQTLVITLGGAVPTGTSIKVFVSETVSAGVSSIGTKLRQLTSFPAAHAAALTLTTPYLARFGTIGAVGSKIFYKIVPVNAVTGQAGAAISGTIVITS
jgi:hypothetical protein